MDNKTNQPMVISGLIKRRRDLQAKHEHLTIKASAIKADIITLDKAIKVIEPDFDLKTIVQKRYQAPMQRKPLYHQEAMQVLTADQGFLSAVEICQRLPSFKYSEMRTADKKCLRGRVRSYLIGLSRKGFLEKEDHKYRLKAAEFWESLD